MRIIDVIATANANTLRSKLRTSLTVIAIFIGAFTLTLTNGLGSGISKYIDTQVDNLGAKDILIIQSDQGETSGGAPKKYDPSKKISATSFGTTTTVFTDEDISKIRKVTGVKSVEPNLIVTPEFIQGPNNERFQVSANPYITGTNVNLAAGSQLDNSSNQLQALLPIEYIGPLGFSNNEAAVGQTVTIGVTDATGAKHIVTATLKGVQQKGLTNAGGMNTNTALTNAIFQAQSVGLPQVATNSYMALIVKFDPGYSESQITDLKGRLKDAGYTAKTVQDTIGSFKQVITGIILVLNAFAIIALLAAGFGIINTLLMSVQERTKEIGLMKAMGMGGGKIFLLFSAEAVVLGFWGSLFGVLAAMGAGKIINNVVSNGILKDLAGLQLLVFPWQSILAIMGLVMAIAFLAGTLPAFRAARQNPIDSLRYE